MQSYRQQRGEDLSLEDLVWQKVREELGFDLNQLYKSTEEQEEYAKKTDLDRTIL